MEAGARAAPEKEILDRVKLEWLATHAREAATDDGGDRVASDGRRARAKEIAIGDGWEAQIRASTSVVERPRVDPRSKPRASEDEARDNDRAAWRLGGPPAGGDPRRGVLKKSLARVHSEAKRTRSAHQIGGRDHERAHQIERTRSAVSTTTMAWTERSSTGCGTTRRGSMASSSGSTKESFGTPTVVL